MRPSNGSWLRVRNVPFATRSSTRQSFDVELMRLQIVLMKCFRTDQRDNRSGFGDRVEVLMLRVVLPEWDDEF